MSIIVLQVQNNDLFLMGVLTLKKDIKEVSVFFLKNNIIEDMSYVCLIMRQRTII